MTDGARPSTFGRLLRVTSPEMMAGLLSVPVLAVVLAIALAAGTGPEDPPRGGVVGSAPPSDGLIGASPTAGPTTTGALPSPTATGRVAWAPEARVLLQADEDMLAMRDRLSKVAEARPVNTNEIAKQMRAMNPALTSMLRLVDAMEAKGAPADLVADVRAAYATALDASLDALTASLSSRSAYLTGAANVVASLSDLETLMARVEQEAGSRPAASP